MKGWGIEERRQSDVSAYSRAKERIVTVCVMAEVSGVAQHKAQQCRYSLTLYKA